MQILIEQIKTWTISKNWSCRWRWWKDLLANAVNKYGEPLNYENYITLEEAKEIDPDLEIGDFMNYDLEFENMGRNAATILHNNFEYRLQRFIEENIVSKYKEKLEKH